MSEEVDTGRDESPPAELPLSVLIFYEAMRRQRKMSEFANDLNINPLSLRQFVRGKTQRPRSTSLSSLAELLDVTEDEVRRLAGLAPAAAPPFHEWFQAAVTEARLSRAHLTRSTGISDGALRNYLEGKTLPDSHQAQQIAEVLSADPLEVAKVIVADETVRHGGSTLPSTALPPVAMAHGEHNGSAAPDSMLTDSPTRSGSEEQRLLHLWRQLHPQARRATFTYIASLLAES